MNGANRENIANTASTESLVSAMAHENSKAKETSRICKHFGICGGCDLDLPYSQQLEKKKESFSQGLGFAPERIEDSPISGYRCRAEFRIHRVYKGEKLSELFLSMNAVGVNSRVPIENCLNLLPILQEVIAKLPSLLLSSPQLEHKLYAIHLLGNRENACILTLIYHKRLDSIWQEQAHWLLSTLSSLSGLDPSYSGIVGRSRKQEISIKNASLTHTLHLRYNTQESSIRFSHLAGTFCQPNPFCNEKMLQYVVDSVSSHPRSDLLELYCGSGNFTLALAPLFTKVLATEVVKSTLLQQNLEQNGVSNVAYARLSGSESIQALERRRSFFRLRHIHLDSFDFSHILVDPPRSGIGDPAMLEFMGRFPYILYVSCNPESLQKDLNTLRKTHKVAGSALFDQFPHTHHLESILILQKVA